MARASPVLLIGAGALGSRVAALLTGVGITQISIIDRSVAVEHDLQWNPVLTRENLQECLRPRPVALAYALKTKKLSPYPRGIAVEISPFNIEKWVPGTALVIDASGDPETRALLAASCARHKQPLVHIGCDAESWQLQLTLPERAACPFCNGSPSFPGAALWSTIDPNKCDRAADLVTATAVCVLAGRASLVGENIIRETGAVSESIDLRPDGNCEVCREGILPSAASLRFERSVLVIEPSVIQIRPTAIGNVPGSKWLPEYESAWHKPFSLFDRLSGFSRSPVEERIWVRETRILDGKQLFVFRSGRALVFGTEACDIALAAYKELVGASWYR